MTPDDPSPPDQPSEPAQPRRSSKTSKPKVTPARVTPAGTPGRAPQPKVAVGPGPTAAGEGSSTELIGLSTPEGELVSGSQPAADDLRPANIEIQQGGIARAEATDIAVHQGGIAIARAERASVETGGIGLSVSEQSEVRQGLVGTIFAHEARIERSAVGSVMAATASFPQRAAVGIVIALRVEGDVRALLDWRGALAGGAALGIVLGILRRR